jgi:hypothetical protein
VAHQRPDAAQALRQREQPGGAEDINDEIHAVVAEVVEWGERY